MEKYMLDENKTHPPFILRLVNEPFSALEALVPFTTGMPTISQPNLPAQTEEDFDKYILAQYLMYLYIKIFVFEETSVLYKNILDKGLVYIRSQQMMVQDIGLKDLIKNHVDRVELPNSPESIQLLESVIMRVHPMTAYPTIPYIVDIVLAVYGRRRIGRNGIALIHRVSLQNVTGYDDPALILSPCFQTTFDSSGYEQTPNFFWKFIYSLNIQNKISQPGDLTQYMNLLATLALPLDPTSLTITMRESIAVNVKSGIPFVNYLAMFLRQRNMGLQYEPSPFADARRILMMRAHQFCGVGGTCISDKLYTKAFLELISRSIDTLSNEKNDAFTEEDMDIFTGITKGIQDVNIKFIKSMKYEEAAEAAKPPNDNTQELNDVNATPTDDSKEGAFANDPDPTDDSNEDPQPIDENADDTIDRTSDVGQDSAVGKTKAFIPLALPTETIDDHLLRLAVMQYTRDVDQDPDPDITPENLEILKYWCGSWLFIASIDQTKKLLTQLGIKSQLKELSL